LSVTVDSSRQKDSINVRRHRPVSANVDPCKDGLRQGSRRAVTGTAAHVTSTATSAILIAMRRRVSTPLFRRGDAQISSLDRCSNSFRQSHYPEDICDTIDVAAR